MTESCEMRDLERSEYLFWAGEIRRARKKGKMYGRRWKVQEVYALSHGFTTKSDRVN